MARLPTLYDSLIFQAKATLLRLRRAIRDRSGPDRCVRWPLSQTTTGQILAESRSPLWNAEAPHAEQILQAGKVHNLRLASRRLDGCRVQARAGFQLLAAGGMAGTLERLRPGTGTAAGCLIPSIAGGLCQLSNALYDCALKAGFIIKERHRHTQVISGSLAAIDRDATVFWNYIDLRFSFEREFQIRIAMTKDELLVQIWG